MALENEKDIIQLKNRLQDLAERAYAQNLFTFTGFLGLGNRMYSGSRRAGCDMWAIPWMGVVSLRSGW